MQPEPDTRFPTDPRISAAWRDDSAFLTGQARRMVGSPSEAEDVVQEAFGRLARADVAAILDVRGWLTVVVRRICLDRLRSAYARREVAGLPADDGPGSSPAGRPPGADGADPADRVTLDEQVSQALGVVLDRLTPAERTAFVLHDVFDLPFDSVAEIVGRSVGACRQLASRARHAVREGGPRSIPGRAAPVSDVAERFVAAAAGGDLHALVALLDPDVDGAASLLGMGLITQTEGAAAVAEQILALFGPGTRRTLAAVPLDDGPGLVAFEHDRVTAVIRLELSEAPAGPDARPGEGVRIRHLEAFVRPPGR